MKVSGGRVGHSDSDPRHYDEDPGDDLALVAAALESLSTATLILDPHMTIRYLNPAARKLLGDELSVGASAQLALDELEREGRFEHLPGAVTLEDGAVQGEFIFRRREGGAYPVAYTTRELSVGSRQPGILVELRDLSEERRIEERIRRSEERFRTLVLTDAMVVWVGGADGMMLDAPLWEQVTGQSLEAAQGMGWLESVHPDDRAGVEEVWAQVRSSPTPAQISYRLRHSSGGYHYVREHVTPILDGNGQVREWVGTISDVHESRMAEVAKSRLAAIVEPSDDAIISKTLDGEITSWNRAAEILFDYSAAEAIGQRIQMIIPEERLGEETEIISRLRKGERVTHFETVRQRKDGTPVEISLSVSPIVDADGKIVGASKIARDITRQKRAQFELENQSRTLSTLLRVATSLAADLDVQRLAQVVADGGREMSGAQFTAFFYNALEEDGKPVTMRAVSGISTEALEGFAAAAGLRTPDPALFPSGPVRSGDVTADERIAQGTLNGMRLSELPFRSYMAVPLALRSGEVIGVLVFGHEDAGAFDERAEMMVSALAGHAATALDNARLYEQALAMNVTLEEKVKQRTAELSALNQELESFNYSVSHDLRAPLRGIDGFSQVLLEDYADKLDEDGQHYLNRIRVGAKRMSSLIDDLLDLSYLSRTSLHVEEIDLTALVRHLAAELQEREPERRVKVIVPDTLTAQGDVSLVQILLENLLGNSWKYTRDSDPALIRVGTLERDGQTVYFVQDNGSGFSMEFSHKLFAPFQRLHAHSEYEGTGIGLATVHRIVRRHGGDIWAESVEGQGATFYFTLPGPAKPAPKKR